MLRLTTKPNSSCAWSSEKCELFVVLSIWLIKSGIFDIFATSLFSVVVCCKPRNRGSAHIVAAGAAPLRLARFEALAEGHRRAAVGLHTRNLYEWSPKGGLPFSYLAKTNSAVPGSGCPRRLNLTDRVKSRIERIPTWRRTQ